MQAENMKAVEDNSLKEIEDLTRELEKKSNKIYSLFNIHDGIDEAHVMYHHALSNLLGRPDELNKKGKLKSNFDFTQNDFLLFSFKSYKGQIPGNVEIIHNKTDKLVRRRFNLYRKGKIWSDESLNNGKNFYAFLDSVHDLFGETPINFISNCVVEYMPTNKAAKVFITQNEEKKHDPSYIYFPSSKILREKLNNSALNKVLEVFDQATSIKFLSNSSPQEDIKAYIRDLDNYKSGLIELIDDELFSYVIERYQSYFNIPTMALDKDKVKEKIFLTSILYCYNNLPFDLYLFYPPTGYEPRKLDADNIFTLMVAMNPEYSLLEEDTKLFERIVEISPNLPEYEQAIHSSAQKHTDSLLRWKYIYEQNLMKYATFMSAVENICKSLCEHHHIKATVTSRLKSFESFYNKLVDRANKPEEHSLVDIRGRKHTYRDVLIYPDELKDLVFESIRDIAGVRIICVFDDDVWKLAAIFRPNDAEVEAKLSNKDLIRTKPKYYEQNVQGTSEEYQDVYNYRGFHITVRPGETRKELVEYMNVDNVQCEIQIRTIFAHGWSDVQHPMLYKDNMHLSIIDSAFNHKIEEKLTEISRELKRFDEEISQLKKERDNFKFPVDD